MTPAESGLRTSIPVLCSANENKYARDSDELSTSAGSSDNEVSVTSGDEETTPRTTTSKLHAPAKTPKHGSKKGFLAELVQFALDTLLKLCAAFSSLFCPKDPQPVPP